LLAPEPVVPDEPDATFAPGCEVDPVCDTWRAHAMAWSAPWIVDPAPAIGGPTESSALLALPARL
jgi:hypothetical protein